MMNFTTTVVTWQAEKLSLMCIRDLVFLQEQQVPVADEWDDKDETATHFVAKTDSSEVIACARLLLETHAAKPVFHIGRVAVLKDYRNQGIGRKFMQFILAYCKQQNSTRPLYLHAQTTRQKFYEHLHFAAQGEIFMDANIPHIEMWYTP